MFKKNKKEQTISSVRQRRQVQSSGQSFRRNAVVISRTQKEVAARQQSVTQRQIEQKRLAGQRKTRNRIILVIFAVAVVLSLHKMNLSSVVIDSNASTKLGTEQKLMYENTVLQTYRAHTVAGQWWLADTDALSTALLKQYPEIEHVTFASSAPLSSVLKTDIRFRKAVFSWKDASGSRQYVDKNGVLFQKNLDPSVNSTKLIEIEDQSGLVIDSGEAALSESAVQFIGQLHSTLPPLFEGNAISKVVIPLSTREVQVQPKNINYFIKFNTSRKVEDQIKELASLLAYLKSKNITPSMYIDIRLEHKAYFK